MRITEQNQKGKKYMKATEPNTIDLETLEEECREVENMKIHYTLYKITISLRDYYAIEIRTENEAELRFVGRQHSRSQRIFEMLFNEQVTPCTFSEILRDLTAEDELLHYCQNLSYSSKETLYKSRQI